jgi:PPM family protein phosphatase
MSTEREGMRVGAYASSDVGLVRKGNEDSMFAGTTVFAVADGMGGHQAGEVASDTALESLRKLDGLDFESEQAAARALADAILEANRSVVSKADADPDLRGMGTTLTAVLLLGERMLVAHVGDSRAYLLRDQGLSQLTTDHTLVEQLIRDGRLSREEAATHPQRSVITRAIGIEQSVEVDSMPGLALQAGDQILLCSDGLTGPVSDEDIAEILATTPDGDAACQALIDAANEGGGPDNITVVLLRVGESEATAASARHAPAAGADRATEDLEPAASTGPVTMIRTRQESGRDWATSMGRYGQPQGHERPAGTESSGRGKRVLAILLALIVIAGVLVGGGTFLLSRAWFVGDLDGSVAVFRGLPQEAAGVDLNRVDEITEIPLGALSERQQERLSEGVTFGSRDEADDYLDDLRTEVEEARDDDGPDVGDDPPDADDADADTDA